jgi:hypothetical protein
MSQVLLDPGTSQVLSTIDTMMTELYALRSLFNVSGTAIAYGAPNVTWGSSYKAFDFASNSGPSVGGASGQGVFGVNSYYNGTAWTYKATGAATLYLANGGGASPSHVLYYAASGTAGTSITWTQGLQLDASGNLNIGTGTTNPGVQIVPSGVVTIGNIAQASGWGFEVFSRSGTAIGSISQSGTTGVAYNTSSDYRLKDAVAPIAGSGAFIDALKPCIWTWKSDGSAGAGFIAHELQAVSPSSVTGAKDAVDADGQPIYQAVEYGSAEVIAMLVAEVQDLRRRVAAGNL